MILGKSQESLILTVQHGYKSAGIGRIGLVLGLVLGLGLVPAPVLVLVLVPEPWLGHERGLELPELPPPWSLGCTFDVVDTDLGEHVGEVGPVALDDIAGPDGHGGVES